MKNGIDDGVIKYDRTNFTQCEALNYSEYAELETWRTLLYRLNLIGEYPVEQAGFGNMSKAQNYEEYSPFHGTQFVITGTQTGKHPKLNGEHYTRVLGYDIALQKINVLGPLEASSEALTHAAIYEANPNIKAIFHIHSKPIWDGMKNDLSPSTHEDIPYGTLEMANAVKDLIAGQNNGVICMRGHEDGVIAYAETTEAAGDLILDLYFNYVEKKVRPVYQDLNNEAHL